MNNPLDESESRQSKVRSGAMWFYIIAILSGLNSATVFTHWDHTFSTGLGITQVVDGMLILVQNDRPDLAPLAMGITILIHFIALTTCALFGFFASRSEAWAFKVGMTLYALDALIFVLSRHYISFGLHLLILSFIHRGLRNLD